MVAGAGVLVPEGSAEALASGVEQLRDPEARRQVGLRGRAVVERDFNVRRTAQHLSERFSSDAV